MLTKNRNGNTFTALLIAGLVLISAVTGIIFVLNQLHIITPSTNNIADADKFKKESILREVKFTNSQGKKKKLIVYRSNNDIVVPLADTYIVDENLSMVTSIKIDELSNDDSLVQSVQSVISGKNGLFITASKDGAKKYILVSISVDDATSMTIIDEDGAIVSQNVVDNVYSHLKTKCHCQYQFSEWNDSKFYVKVNTNFGEEFRVLIEARDGSIIGEIEEV